MSFGTLLPLLVFLASYVVHLTLVAAPIARAGYRFGVWLSTFGQAPPVKRKPDSRPADGEEKTSVAEQVRRYSPAAYVRRRERPVALPIRIVWFVLAGWWLGGVWVVLSWSVLLAPYPFPATVAALLEELPGVMVLAGPATSRQPPQTPAHAEGAA
jgi:uncharacterized membrane protein YccF (DUF307 family)